MYLLGGIGDIVKDNPRVVQFVLNASVSSWPLSPPLGRAETDVSIDLLLLNIRHKREDITVTVSISRINIPNPLINVVQWSQMLVPLPRHPVLCGGVKVRVCLHVPELVGQYTDWNFTLKIKNKNINLAQ